MKGSYTNITSIGSLLVFIRLYLIMYNSLERLKDAIADVLMDESITTEQIVRAIKNEVTDWR